MLALIPSHKNGSSNLWEGINIIACSRFSLKQKPGLEAAALSLYHQAEWDLPIKPALVSIPFCWYKTIRFRLLNSNLNSWADLMSTITQWIFNQEITIKGYSINPRNFSFLMKFPWQHKAFAIACRTSHNRSRPIKVNEPFLGQTPVKG